MVVLIIRTRIPSRVDIDERPEVANNREEFRHFEADTIIDKGHQGAIVTWMSEYPSYDGHSLLIANTRKA